MQSCRDGLGCGDTRAFASSFNIGIGTLGHMRSLCNLALGEVLLGSNCFEPCHFRKNPFHILCSYIIQRSA